MARRFVSGEDQPYSPNDGYLCQYLLWAGGGLVKKALEEIGTADVHEVCRVEQAICGCHHTARWAELGCDEYDCGAPNCDVEYG